MSDNCGCGRYGCTCVDYSIDDVTASNDDFIVKMRHLKCRVTHLVRNQMRKSASELRETNYSSYSASSKSPGKLVNNKGTQLSSLSSLSSINPHESKLIDHTSSRQLTTSSQENTTESSRPNYSNSTLERSKAAGGYIQPTARTHPAAHSTLIDTTANYSKVANKINHELSARKSNVPYNVVTIHPPPLSQSTSTLPQVSVSDVTTPTTHSVAVETLPNMFDFTEFTPSNFDQPESTTMDSSTQATSQVSTSTQATDLMDRGTSTAKIQTDVITSTINTPTTTTTTTTTTETTATSFPLKIIRIIYNGLISILSFFYRIKKIILMILMIGLLLWAAVIYGAILGATICTSAGGYPLFQITLPPSRPVYF